MPLIEGHGAEHCRARQSAQRASRMETTATDDGNESTGKEAALEWPTCNAPRLVLMPGAAGGICSATHQLHGCSIPFA